MRLLGISGSLRLNSNNGRLLGEAQKHLPPGVEFELADCLGDLPHFNPDIDSSSIPVMASWIEQVKQSDGLVISSPEYARGYPGTLKNAFDWLVQTDAHIDKPFMLWNASSRSTVARDSLIVVLETMSGIHIENASVTVNLLGKGDSVADVLSDPETGVRLNTSLKRFTTEIGKRLTTN